MRYPRVLRFLSGASAYRVVASCVLAAAVLSAISDQCHGQFGPLWIGQWQRYEGGGQYSGTGPSVSPDGASVVYSTPATGHGDIYRYDRASKKNARLTLDPGYDGSPCYSKDGKEIFFVRELHDVGHVWVMNADGSHQRRLTDGLTYDVWASFSKSGEKVLL